MKPENISNLFMHAAYYKELENCEISKQITLDDKREINEALSESLVFLRNARKKIHSVENKGRYHTGGLWKQYQALDTIINDLVAVSNLVNQTEPEIKIADYPID